MRQGDLRVRVSRDAAVAGPAVPTPDVAPPPPPAAGAAAPVVKAAAAVKDGGKAVTAPLTGIFYRSPSPQAPPFVQVGSVISPGDVVGLIEAMKLFNEVRSPVAGRVRRIAADSGQLVRAHAPLVELE